MMEEDKDRGGSSFENAALVERLRGPLPSVYVPFRGDSGDLAWDGVLSRERQLRERREAADEIERLSAELARFKRFTKAEYHLISDDGGIAISFPAHQRDARQRALEWREWHPAYAIELVSSECWGTDWEVVGRQVVRP